MGEAGIGCGDVALRCWSLCNEAKVDRASYGQAGLEAF